MHSIFNSFTGLFSKILGLLCIPLLIPGQRSTIQNILIGLVTSIACGLLGRMIVRSKKYPKPLNHGFAWGFWLNLLGLLICLLKPKYRNASVSRSYRNRSTSARKRQTRQTGYSRRSQMSRNVTPENFDSKLNTLHDRQDNVSCVSNATRLETKDVVDTTRAAQRQFRSKDNLQTVTLDTSWTHNLQELMEVTAIVYSNAELNCQKRLLRERFDYYINLHYRSFTAADLCHAKAKEVMAAKDSCNKLLDRCSSRSDPFRLSKADFDALVAIRNRIGKVHTILTSRRDMLNKQSGLIRDKINAECGERGQRWYADLMARAGKA